MNDSCLMQLSYHHPRFLGEVAIDNILQSCAVYMLHLELKARDIAYYGRKNPVPAGIGCDPGLPQSSFLPDALIQFRQPIALGQPPLLDDVVLQSYDRFRASAYLHKSSLLFQASTRPMQPVIIMSPPGDAGTAPSNAWL